jgi:membrane protein required for colicin V production
LSIDVVFFIILLFAIFKGIAKGLILGIFSFLAFIIGLAAALKLSAVVAHHLEDSTGSAAKWVPVISFVLVFLVVALLVKIAAGIIKKVMTFSMLGWVDKIGGIIFYMIIYTIIYSVLLFFAAKTSLLSPQTIAASNTYDYIIPWGPKIIDNLGKIIPIFKDLFLQLQIFFEKLGNKFAG